MWLPKSEWAAIQAAAALKVTWDAPHKPFPEQADLYEHMRTTTPKSTKTVKTGRCRAALASAAKKVEATYDFPFQSHATMGPGCAVADVQRWTDDNLVRGQKPHALRLGIAEMLGVSPDSVRVIWVEDAGSYGRPGFEDAAADAALLSKAAGQPVRVQWMRADMTAWGTKGPAVVCIWARGSMRREKLPRFNLRPGLFPAAKPIFSRPRAGNFWVRNSPGCLTRAARTNLRNGGRRHRVHVWECLMRFRTSSPRFFPQDRLCAPRISATQKGRPPHLPPSLSWTKWPRLPGSTPLIPSRNLDDDAGKSGA